MIIVQHEPFEEDDNLKFTVIFEHDLNEHEILENEVDANEGKMDFEQALANIIMKHWV